MDLAHAQGLRPGGGQPGDQRCVGPRPPRMRDAVRAAIEVLDVDWHGDHRRPAPEPGRPGPGGRGSQDGRLSPQAVSAPFGEAADEVVGATRDHARRGQRLGIAADFNAVDRRITRHLREPQANFVRDEYGRRLEDLRRAKPGAWWPTGSRPGSAARTSPPTWLRAAENALGHAASLLLGGGRRRVRLERAVAGAARGLRRGGHRALPHRGGARRAHHRDLPLPARQDLRRWARPCERSTASTAGPPGGHQEPRRPGSARPSTRTPGRKVLFVERGRRANAASPRWPARPWAPRTTAGEFRRGRDERRADGPGRELPAVPRPVPIDHGRRPSDPNPLSPF